MVANFYTNTGSSPTYLDVDSVVLDTHKHMSTGINLWQNTSCESFNCSGRYLCGVGNKGCAGSARANLESRFSFV